MTDLLAAHQESVRRGQSALRAVDETIARLTPQSVMIVVPGEPVPWAQNSSPVAVKGNVRYRPIPKRQERAFATVRLAAGQAMAEARLGLFNGPLQLELRAELPIRPSWTKKKQRAARDGTILPTGTPDLGKLLRLVEDALNGVVYTDDARVCRQINEKVFSTTPKTVITITPLFAEAAA